MDYHLNVSYIAAKLLVGKMEVSFLHQKILDNTMGKLKKGGKQKSFTFRNFLRRVGANI